MLIVNLKTQITNLVRFFKAIATTVEFVLNKQVKPFITTIKAITSDGVDPNEDCKVGQYTMTDLQRSVSSACRQASVLDYNELRVLCRLFSTAHSPSAHTTLYSGI